MHDCEPSLAEIANMLHRAGTAINDYLKLSRDNENLNKQATALKEIIGVIRFKRRFKKDKELDKLLEKKLDNYIRNIRKCPVDYFVAIDELPQYEMLEILKRNLSAEEFKPLETTFQRDGKVEYYHEKDK